MVGITAIGTANPLYKRPQLETAELICAALDLKPAKKRLLKSVYQATGIDYRHSVLADYCKQPGELIFFPNDANDPFPTTAARMQIYKENALTLALNAIHQCLNQLPEFVLQDITHVITVSCTGMYAPGIDIEIVQHLHLSPRTQRTTINFMGCYGAFNALKVADAICKAEPNANVLVVCVEICTIHFQKNMTLDNIIANAIFADGAAAALIQATPATQKYFNLAAFYCDLLPQAQQQMTWHIADSGFDINLSSYVADTIEHGIAEFTQKLLTQQKLSLDDIDYYAIHPGGNKILQACEKSLGITTIDNQYSYHVLKNFGNMSSTTVLFVLKEIFNSIPATAQTKNIFSCAFGPGLTLEAMLLKI